jgi:hypothetical protein
MPYLKKNKKRTEAIRDASVSYFGDLHLMSKKKRTLHLFLEPTGEGPMQQKTRITKKIEAGEVNPFNRIWIQLPTTTTIAAAAAATSTATGRATGRETNNSK